MTRQQRSTGAALVLALFVALFAAGTARAQVGWACANTVICNQTGCPIRLQLRATPPGVVLLVNLGPAACVFVPTPVITLNQVVSAAGIGYPILPPPPVPPCNCLPGDWSVCCVTLPPANCCCDVCFDPANCRITVRPAACPPGACNP